MTKTDADSRGAMLNHFSCDCISWVMLAAIGLCNHFMRDAIGIFASLGFFNIFFWTGWGEEFQRKAGSQRQRAYYFIQAGVSVLIIIVAGFAIRLPVSVVDILVFLGVSNLFFWNAIFRKIGVGPQ
jgi:hypothetical protein